MFNYHTTPPSNTIPRWANPTFQRYHDFKDRPIINAPEEVINKANSQLSQYGINIDSITIRAIDKPHKKLWSTSNQGKTYRYAIDVQFTQTNEHGVRESKSLSTKYYVHSKVNNPEKRGFKKLYHAIIIFFKLLFGSTTLKNKIHTNLSQHIDYQTNLMINGLVHQHNIQLGKRIKNVTSISEDRLSVTEPKPRMHVEKDLLTEEGQTTSQAGVTSTHNQSDIKDSDYEEIEVEEEVSDYEETEEEVSDGEYDIEDEVIEEEDIDYRKGRARHGWGLLRSSSNRKLEEEYPDPKVNLEKKVLPEKQAEEPQHPKRRINLLKIKASDCRSNRK